MFLRPLASARKLQRAGRRAHKYWQGCVCSTHSTTACIAQHSFSQQLLTARLELADRAKDLTELLKHEPQMPRTPAAELSNLSPDVAMAAVESWKLHDPWPAYNEQYAD